MFACCQTAFGGDIGPEGEVYTSVYSISGGLGFGVIFASELTKPYALTPAAAGLDSVRPPVGESCYRLLYLSC